MYIHPNKDQPVKFLINTSDYEYCEHNSILAANESAVEKFIKQYAFDNIQSYAPGIIKAFQTEHNLNDECIQTLKALTDAGIEDKFFKCLSEINDNKPFRQLSGIEADTVSYDKMLFSIEGKCEAVATDVNNVGYIE